jgi:hypothetical protein
LCSTAALNQQSQPDTSKPLSNSVVERSAYQIHLKLDLEKREYSGSERVRFVNRGEHSTSLLYFHLYANVRIDQPQATPPVVSYLTASDSDEPQIQITEVHATNRAELPFSLDDQGTTLRVNLREPVLPGGTTEVVIGFKGSVPEIDSDETGITTHVVKQVSAAIRGEREIRRARDINFRCRGVMLLGTAYPVLAVREGDDWRRRIEPSVGDMVFNEAADYEVIVETEAGVSVFTSGTQTPTGAGEKRTFTAPLARDFAIVASRNFRSDETQVGSRSRQYRIHRPDGDCERFLHRL